MASLSVTLPNVSMCMNSKLRACQTPKGRQNSWEHFWGVQDVRTMWIWRACLVEMIFVALFVFSSIVICTGTKFQFSSPLLAIAIFHLVMFGVLLRAAIPPSDGHFNPAITLSAVFTGIYTPIKGLMYITAQSVGGIFGALGAKSLLPVKEVENNLLAGCRHRNTISGLNGSQAFLSEFLFSFILIYIIFMVCIDRKQFQSIGLERVPLFIGVVTAFNIYVSGMIAPGYNGAYMNPARCIGPAVAYGGAELFSSLWIFWCAPALAAAAVATLYRLVPPDHRQLTSNCDEQQLKCKATRTCSKPVDEEQPGNISPQNMAMGPL